MFAVWNDVTDEEWVYEKWIQKGIRRDFRQAGEEENLYAVYRRAAKAGRFLRKSCGDLTINMV